MNEFSRYANQFECSGKLNLELALELLLKRLPCLSRLITCRQVFQDDHHQHSHDEQEDEFVRERIQHLVHRFADRARKMRSRIEMPPTPSLGPSTPPSPQHNDNGKSHLQVAVAPMEKSNSMLALLQHKLNMQQQGNNHNHTPNHDSHGHLSAARTDSKRSIEDGQPEDEEAKKKRAAMDEGQSSKCMSTHWMCPTFCGGGKSSDVLDPQGRFYISWLFLVTMSFVYNAYCIPFRVSFPFQTPENTPVWLAMDYCCDLIYLLDVVFVKHRLIYLYDGFWVKDKAMTRQNYIRKLQFKVRGGIFLGGRFN